MEVFSVAMDRQSLHFGGDSSPHPVTPLSSSETGLLGDSPGIRQVREFLGRFAHFDAPVLITGESGTGKEMAARALHYSSNRRDGPFIPVNCGALPDDLIENELFGHERGAFTGAKDMAPGLVEQAAQGTLFLDEVGTLSAKGQCTLLRFLQSHEFKRLGGQTLCHADVRVIAATNADLKDMVGDNTFREDLLFRLDVLSFRMPPLRERGADLLRLAEHFLALYLKQYQLAPKRFSTAAIDWLRQQPWLGNVRELENTIHRAVLLCNADDVSCRELAPHSPTSALTEEAPSHSSQPALPFQDAKADAIERFEKRYLTDLMAYCHGNVSRAARLAGKERRALGKLLKKHGIDRLQFA